jgi:hypothetical protein
MIHRNLRRPTSLRLPLQGGGSIAFTSDKLAQDKSLLKCPKS